MLPFDSPSVPILEILAQEVDANQNQSRIRFLFPENCVAEENHWASASSQYVCSATPLRLEEK